MENNRGPYSVPNTPTAIVYRLLEEVKGSNRNVTCDNWYSSYPLTKESLENKITIIGTMKKNKRKIPPEFLPQKSRTVGSSLFGFKKINIGLVRFKEKQICCIDFYNARGFSHRPTLKNKLILQYNATKGGVDTVDNVQQLFCVSKNKMVTGNILPTDKHCGNQRSTAV